MWLGIVLTEDSSQEERPTVESSESVGSGVSRSDRRGFVRKLVSLAALGSITGLLMGDLTDPLKGQSTDNIFYLGGFLNTWGQALLRVDVPGTTVIEGAVSATNTDGADNSTGVDGWANDTGSGFTFGVHGESDSTNGVGVKGLALASTGATKGVWGESDSTNGIGVIGYAPASTGTTMGVYGNSASTNGKGVLGYAPASTGTTYGVFGEAASTGGRGVFGWALAPTGSTTGVLGESDSPNGIGVLGVANSTPGIPPNPIGVGGAVENAPVVALGAPVGVLGAAKTGRGVGGFSFNGGEGVLGISVASPPITFQAPTQIGVHGIAQTGVGVVGQSTDPSNSAQGVVGTTENQPIPSRQLAGVHGVADVYLGVLGQSNSGVGVVGNSGTGIGVDGVGGFYGVYGSTGNVLGKPMVARGVANQVANLQEWQNSSGTALCAVDANGNFVMGHSRTNSGAFMAKDTGGTARNIMFIGGDNNIYMVNDIPSSLYVVQVAATSRAQFGTPLWLSARGTYTDFFMNNSGQIGIGTASPSHLIQLSGGAYSDGSTWNPASSVRWKENITPLTDGVDTLKQLHPVAYNYKKTPGKRTMGFIAEQVGKVLPTVVDWDKAEAGYAEGYDHVAVLALAVQAIKEQQATIQQLQERTAFLEKTVKQLAAS